MNSPASENSEIHSWNDHDWDNDPLYIEAMAEKALEAMLLENPPEEFDPLREEERAFDLLS